MKKTETRNPAAENVGYLRDVERFLARRGILSAAVEAEGLIRHFGGTDRLDFFTGKKNLSEARRRRLERALLERVRGTPLSYITGETGFFGHSFVVNRNVLIPRLETEWLVEQALLVLNRYFPVRAESPPRVLDLCTGSGCIAVSLTMARPDCKMTAADVCSKALQVARRNIRRHGLMDKIRVVQSDLFGVFEAKKSVSDRRFLWDVLVANPPYIPEEEFGQLPTEVLAEPRLALDGGRCGLKMATAILRKSPRFLKKGGWLLMEIGQGQAGPLSAEALRHGVYRDLSFIKDASGIDRIFVARRG